ncbi:MAG: GAF domain-containing protein [Pseudomonadota bacterium]
MDNNTDYALLLAQATALTESEPDALANLSNISALVFETLPDLNWCGFYLNRGDELVLGPFQGRSACTRIGWGKGVCGTAAATGETQRIADVHAFEGHIACDAASESELVVPLTVANQVIGVLDIDSPRKARFSAEDQDGIEAIAKLCERLLELERGSVGLG